MSHILTKSALYAETKDMPESIDVSIVTDNSVIQALYHIGTSTSDLFKYTRSFDAGHIHPCLEKYSKEELAVSYQLIEFWQFPKDWSIAVQEEMALKDAIIAWKAAPKVEEYDPTQPPMRPYKYIPELLQLKADEIGRNVCIYDGPIGSDFVFKHDDDDDELDVAYHLGRYQYAVDDILSLHTPENDELIASAGYIDLLEWYNYYIPTDVSSSRQARIAVECGHLNILQWIHSKKYYWNWNECLLKAYTRMQDDIVDWIKANKMNAPKIRENL